MQPKRLLLPILLAATGIASLQAQEQPPCTIDFTDAAAFDSQVLVVDANRDNITWQYDDSEGAPACDAGQAAQDWLISRQSISLKAGETYAVAVTAKTDARYNPQTFYTYIGSAPAAESLTTRIESDETSISDIYFASNERGTFTVNADGDYYVGIYFYSPSYYNGTFWVSGISISPKPEYPGAVAGAAATAGENGALTATLSWTNPSTNTDGGALRELSGVKIYRSTSRYFYVSDAYLTATLTTDGYAEAGAQLTWQDNSITTPGTYYYMIVPFNSNGNSTASAQTLATSWIGNDTPQAVTGITVSATADYRASITFELPAEGVNGGYVNPDATTYKIERRTTADYSFTVVENAYVGPLPYTDIDTEQLAKYIYRITPAFDGREGDSANSAATVLGYASVPYSEAFDEYSSLDFYTIINGNGDSYEWEANNSYSPSYVRLSGSSAATECNDWLITPPIRFEAGKTYRLDFDSRINTYGTAHEKRVEVCMGNAPEAAALATCLLQASIANTDDSTYTVYFTTAATGISHIGFHCTFSGGSSMLILDNVSLQESVIMPEAATQFAVTADATGALAATASWTMPTLTNTGSEITTPVTALLYCNDELIYSAEGQAGEAMSYTHSVPEAGEYTFTVATSLTAEGSSTTDAVSVWIGEDLPANTDRVSVTTNDAGQPVVTFEPVTRGANGGYIDPAQVSYDIVRNSGKPDEERIARGITGNTYTDTDELPLGNYTYTVITLYKGNESSGTTSAGITVGGALPLTYTAAFDDAEEMALWSTYDANNDGKCWTYNADKAQMEYTSYSEADDWLFTPPLAVEYAGKHTVIFAASCNSAWTSETLEVALCRSNTPESVYATSEPYEISSRLADEEETDFEIPEEGTWYIAFHITSPDPWGLYLSAVTVKGSIETGTQATRRGNGAYYSPADDCLHLAGQASVTVSDMSGRLVLVQPQACGKVSAEGLPAGVYIAIVTSPDGGTERIKFIK